MQTLNDNFFFCTICSTKVPLRSKFEHINGKKHQKNIKSEVNYHILNDDDHSLTQKSLDYDELLKASIEQQIIQDYYESLEKNK